MSPPLWPPCNPHACSCVPSLPCLSVRQAFMYHTISVSGDAEGWNIAFYVFTGCRSLLFFVVIILLATGEGLPTLGCCAAGHAWGWHGLGRCRSLLLFEAVTLLATCGWAGLCEMCSMARWLGATAVKFVNERWPCDRHRISNVFPVHVCRCRLVLHEALHLRPREEAAHGGCWAGAAQCTWRSSVHGRAPAEASASGGLHVTPAPLSVCLPGGHPSPSDCQCGHHLPGRVYPCSRELVHVRRALEGGGSEAVHARACRLRILSCPCCEPRCAALRKHMPANAGDCTCRFSAHRNANATGLACSLLHAPLHPAAGVISCTWWTLCAAAWCSSPSSGPSSSCAMPAVRAAAWVLHRSSL